MFQNADHRPLRYFADVASGPPHYRLAHEPYHYGPYRHIQEEPRRAMNGHHQRPSHHTTQYSPLSDHYLRPLPSIPGERYHVTRSCKPARGPPGALTAHAVAASGEFVGTFMFLFFSFACQLMLGSQASDVSMSNRGTSSQTNIFTALIYGFSLLVNAWAFYRISGGLFNPAVTLGLVIGNALPITRAVFLLPAQLLGAICAAAVVECMFPGNVSSCNTTVAPGTSIAQGVFIEMFMTAELVFVVLMLAAEKSKDTFMAPIGIGLALFVAMMGGVHYTGGSLNPARSLGPAVAGNPFPRYHWVYWVGPCSGAVVAAGYYRFIKYFKYEHVNPGQDDAGDDSSKAEDSKADGSKEMVSEHV